MDCEKEFLAIRKVARRLGTDIEIVSGLDWGGRKVHPAPFALDLGIQVVGGRAKVIWDPGRRTDREEVGGLIHELGHICVNGDVTSDEFDFLGWEFAVALEADAVDVWLESIQTYGISEDKFDCTEFGCVSPEEQSDLLEERYALAVEKGWVEGGIARRVKSTFRVTPG